MIFKDFKDIRIESDLGVSPVGRDTMLVAKHASTLEFKSSLDIGTGTGFLPIYLTVCGFSCDGSDINPNAITCANKNAVDNDLKINFYLSDLFENIQQQYDLIIFNPPFGNVGSSLFSKYLEIIKSILPKENKFIVKMSFRLIKKQRRKLIKRFFDTCSNFLTKNGKLLIFLHDSELSLLKEMKFRVLDGYNDMNLVLIQL